MSCRIPQDKEKNQRTYGQVARLVSLSPGRRLHSPRPPALFANPFAESQSEHKSRPPLSHHSHSPIPRFPTSSTIDHSKRKR
ncbi:unnamed protein product [Prunus brigantina]